MKFHTKADEVCYNKLDEFRIYLQDELNSLYQLKDRDTNKERIAMRKTGTQKAIQLINDLINNIKMEVTNE